MNLNPYDNPSRLEQYIGSRQFLFNVILNTAIAATLTTSIVYYRLSDIDTDLLRVPLAIFNGFCFGVSVLVFTYHYVRPKAILFAVLIVIAEIIFLKTLEQLGNGSRVFAELFMALFNGLASSSYAKLWNIRFGDSQETENIKGMAVNKVVNSVNKPSLNNPKGPKRQFFDVNRKVNGAVNSPKEGTNKDEGSANQAEGLFKCNICGKSFKTQKALNGHMVAHRNQKSKLYSQGDDDTITIDEMKPQIENSSK